MQFSVATIVAFIAITAAATPTANIKREAVAAPDARSNCYRRGESCTKLKRAAELVEDVFDDAHSSIENPADHVEDGEYAIAKRNALMVREAIAEAEAIADPLADARSSCWRRGEPCSRVKRSALASAEADARSNCSRRGEACSRKSKRSALPDARSNCMRVGESCSRLRRAVEIIDELTFGDDEAFAPVQAAISKL